MEFENYIEELKISILDIHRIIDFYHTHSSTKYYKTLYDRAKKNLNSFVISRFDFQSFQEYLDQEQKQTLSDLMNCFDFWSRELDQEYLLLSDLQTLNLLSFECKKMATIPFTFAGLFLLWSLLLNGEPYQEWIFIVLFFISIGESFYLKKDSKSLKKEANILEKKLKLDRK